jgi:AcrR family transcriptional regulator
MTAGFPAKSPSRSSRTRADASVADRLIEAAEALYGAHGLDGVSLRQISLAAGTGNNYAVQYHFGDAAGLIRAILAKRIPEVDLRRAQLLSKAKAQGRLAEPRTLVDLLYRPVIDHLDSRGERSHARFSLALLSAPQAVDHGADLTHLMPISDHVLDLICAANPEIPLRFIQERLRLITIMVFNCIFNRHAPYDEDVFEPALIDNALDMATAALTAPLGVSVRDMLRQTGSGSGGPV